MRTITAREYLHYCWSGLTLVGRDEDGGLVWLGERKNWMALGWLKDGVYEDERDGGESIIKEYISQ